MKTKNIMLEIVLVCITVTNECILKLSYIEKKNVPDLYKDWCSLYRTDACEIVYDIAINCK